jgi:hypothetical protein
MGEIKIETRKGSGSLALPKATAPSLQLPSAEKSSTTSASLATPNLPASSLVVRLREKLMSKTHTKPVTKATSTTPLPTLSVKPSASVFDRLITYLAHLIKIIDYLLFGKLKNYIAHGPKVVITTEKDSPLGSARLKIPDAHLEEDPALKSPHFEDDEDGSKKKSQKPTA